MFIQGIRGATTIQADNAEEIKLKTKNLLKEIMLCNNIRTDEIIYILFTATDDIKSAYPAVAAREMGLDHIPLLCCQEMSVIDSLNKCIRVLMLVQRSHKTEIMHIYQEEAVSLRPDLIEKQKRSGFVNDEAN